MHVTMFVRVAVMCVFMFSEITSISWLCFSLRKNQSNTYILRKFYIHTLFSLKFPKPLWRLSGCEFPLLHAFLYISTYTLISNTLLRKTSEWMLKHRERTVESAMGTQQPHIPNMRMTFCFLFLLLHKSHPQTKNQFPTSVHW